MSAVAEAVADRPHPARLSRVGIISPLPGWPVIELQLRSSEECDTDDSDLITRLGLQGHDAAAYWSRSANTLLEIVEFAAEVFAAAVDGRRLAGDRLVLHAAPLGDPATTGNLAHLAMPAWNVPVIHLNGVSADAQERAAPLVRDTLDEHRWGPAQTRLPRIGYFEAVSALSFTYPERSPGAAFDPLGSDLNHLCLVTSHLSAVIHGSGAMRIRSAEVRFDIRRDAGG